MVAAQGELNSARALKEAAEVISHSPTALKLRYLQTLNLIATEKSSSIIFPMPIDLAGLGAGLGGGLGNLYGRHKFCIEMRVFHPFLSSTGPSEVI